ncbi:MAG: MBL fold metallo-hydrolase [Bacteroidetes bacterium]|nr:MBL fold metallo-hydrolase [Bacteroidota bacterium]
MRYILFLFLSLYTSSNAISQITEITDSDWCNHPYRESLQKLTEIKVQSNWFKVYRVGQNVIAIVEPYNFEEVISYLILGKNKALLFDTGIGVDSISPVVKQLTKLPVLVLNSHTHFDHIGGNYEFKNILALKTSYTLKHAKEGWNHDSIKDEVTKGSLCLQRLPGFDTSHYYIHPFEISQFVKDGDEVDLGGRKLKIIAVPGHTMDAIALFDSTNGYLWTGDTFYEGPIYLFAEETYLLAYEKSITTLAKMAPRLKKVFPSHNNPISEPVRLVELKNNFLTMKAGKVKPTDAGNNMLLFQFQYFGFLIDKNQLVKFRVE